MLDPSAGIWCPVHWMTILFLSLFYFSWTRGTILFLDLFECTGTSEINQAGKFADYIKRNSSNKNN